MSTTFSTEPGPITGFVITCCCAQAQLRAPRFGTYDDAVVEYRKLTTARDNGDLTRSALPGCQFPQDCPDGQLHVSPVEDDPGPQLNVSCANAKVILAALGYDGAPEHQELCGGTDAEDFLGRVLTALAVAPADAGTQPYNVTPRFIECGRRSGYLQGRLVDLHALAQWCVEHNRPVQWC